MGCQKIMKKVITLSYLWSRIKSFATDPLKILSGYVSDTNYLKSLKPTRVKMLLLTKKNTQSKSRKCWQVFLLQ